MSQEKTMQVTNGWPMLTFNLVLLLASIGLIILGIIHLAAAEAQKKPRPGVSAEALNQDTANSERDQVLGATYMGAGVLTLVAAIISFCGHFTLQPNEACLLLLFGSYVGTVRQSGFWWTNPFNTKRKVSLRARNLEGARLKVNDKRGNPIEIGAVIVWRVEDTAQACFDVENYEDYVKIQSETAVRHLASEYAYDHGEDHEITLRGSGDEVAAALTKELQARLAKAGVHVEESRLTHLAYAPEIAQAMLRRQQAEAVIAARQKIVHGAVSMVQMALHDLAEKQILQLDEERKAAMVSNLLVVLCGETEVHPVVNAGTLYN